MLSIKLITWLTTFILIILCELGDKTQMAVLLLASNNPSRRWMILAASSIALILCVLIEVTLGATLARYVNPAIINRGTGVIFFLIGVFTLTRETGLYKRFRLKKEAAPKQDLPLNSCEEKV